MTKLDIPRKTVYRLSLYQRGLQLLERNQGDTVSSAALAKAAGVKPTKLRKDLTYFGKFGTRGLGYDVSALSKKLDEVLGTTRLQPVLLACAGNLGTALLGYYDGFAKEGFEIVVALDVEAGRRSVGATKVIVRPFIETEDTVREYRVKMAIVAVPATVAQEVVNRLVAAGVQAILNFAPIILQVPPNVVVNNVDLAIELENLSYFIR